jgi:ribonuclease-3
MYDLLKHTSVVEDILGYRFKDKKLLALAFVHRSFYNEHRDLVQEHNERLEFLGDSILGLMVSDYLYKHLPTQAEGELSQLRAHLVEATTCAKFLQRLGLAEYVLLGKGEKMNAGRGRETILADLFEALIGAIYLDGGIEEVRRVFWGHFRHEIEAILQKPCRNWKAELQDYSQKKYQKPPVYRIEKEIGPDHSKTFHVVACLDSQELGKGVGASKKEAEQAAAEDAMKRLYPV